MLLWSWQLYCLLYLDKHPNSRLSINKQNPSPCPIFDSPASGSGMARLVCHWAEDLCMERVVCALAMPNLTGSGGNNLNLTFSQATKGLLNAACLIIRLHLIIRSHLLFSCHPMLFLLSCIFPFDPFLSFSLSSLFSYCCYHSCSVISTCPYHYVIAYYVFCVSSYDFLFVLLFIFMFIFRSSLVYVYLYALTSFWIFLVWSICIYPYVHPYVAYLSYVYLT